jgi:hypothetical protein
MSVMAPNYPIRFPFAPQIVMWRSVAAARRKSMTEPVISVLRRIAPGRLEDRRAGRPEPVSGVALAPWLTVF